MDKNVRVGHFFSKFMEEWHEQWDKQQGKPGNGYQQVKPERREDFEATSLLLEAIDANASHWVLSSEAFSFVWKTDIHSADFENTRLPFQSMIIEYRFDYEALGFDRETVAGDRSVSPERFIVMCELEGDRVLLMSGFKLDADIDETLPVRWVFSPSALIMPYRSIENLSEWMTPTEGGMDVDLTRDFVDIVPSLPVYKGINFDDYSIEERKGVITDLFDELRIALSLLAILSCDNAPTETIQPPEKLNRKREKSGKRLIPPYRTLHITSHSSRPSHGDGTHASPRTHWRRGHIRNQPTAKGIVRKWIRPAIINATGNEVPAKTEVVLT